MGYDDEAGIDVLHPVGEGLDCQLICHCPSVFTTREGNGPRIGQLNEEAFRVHVFCVACKTQIRLDYDLSAATDDDGKATIEYLGECQTCGKEVSMSVQMLDPDAPMVDEVRDAIDRDDTDEETDIARERAYGHEPRSDAERLAQIMENRRKL